MRIVFIYSFLSFLLINVNFAQEQKSCCKLSAPQEFASFSDDENFVNAHVPPVSFTLINGKGKMITFNTQDGNTANAYEVKSDEYTNKYIFVFHEWYGLNDYIKKEAEELQQALVNVNVLALDLYDGKVAENNEDARKYVQSVETQRAVDIIKSALDYTGKNAEIATIGWCFGGAWSLQTAILLNENVKACVMYYGMPEKDTERLNKLNAPVLGIFGKQDASITPKIVEQFEADMKSLNKQITVKMYDAVHAFANPSNPNHDVEATKDARNHTISFLKEQLSLN
ncbi:MAG: dienelactone hydrolase family protein [Ignavibacteria bacterium]